MVKRWCVCLAGCMERVTGIGGIFFTSSDPAATVAWYEKHLGISPAADFPGSVIRWSGGEETIWGAFPDDTEYFGTAGPDGANGQRFMVNYRVADLTAMLAQLRAAGVTVDDNEDHSEFGSFGWAVDCDGRRFELWQPPV